MFCMKCGTKLPDDAVFCFSCGQKVGGNDLVVETMQPVVTDSSAEITNKGKHSSDLASYLKDVWAISKAIIEVNYAIKNQKRKYTIFKSSVESGKRAYYWTSRDTYGLNNLDERYRFNNHFFDKEREMEKISKYQEMGILVFPWEIDIFQDFFQCFGEYFTLEKAKQTELFGPMSPLPRLFKKNGFGGELMEYINFVGGMPYIFKWNPCPFYVNNNIYQDVSMIETLEKMIQNLVNVYREHPQWFSNAEINPYEITEGGLAACDSITKIPLETRRWSALRSTLKDNKLDEMRNVFKNAPSNKQPGFTLFSKRKNDRALTGEYWEEVKKKFPYLQCITLLDHYYDRNVKKEVCTTAFIREEKDIINALYEDIAYIAYPNTVADASRALLGNEKYVEILDNIQCNITELRNLRTQLVELLNKIYAKGNIHPKYQHNYIASAMFYEYIDTKRCSTLEGADGAYNLYERELRMNTIIDKLDIVIDKLGSIDNTMKEISRTLLNISGSLSSINAKTSMIEYNTSMLAMRRDIVNLSVSVSGRY